MDVVRSGRLEVGTGLHLPGIGPVIVVSNADPSVVMLETAHGVQLRLGEKALAQIMQRAPSPKSSATPS